MFVIHAYLNIYYTIVPKTALLNVEYSDNDIFTITAEESGCDFDWRHAGRILVGDSKVTDIQNGYGSEGEKREKMLLEWKRMKSHDATCHELVKVLREIGNKAAADRVEEIQKRKLQLK